jgi:hypothetical protein
MEAPIPLEAPVINTFNLSFIENSFLMLENTVASSEDAAVGV